MTPITPRIIRPGPGFKWPDGRRVAIIFNIAYEAFSDGKTSGVGPMGNVLAPGYYDTNAHSWASYGAVRGIHRLQGIAERHGLRTSVMTNGILAEREAASVAALRRNGHEIVAHSYGQDMIPVYFKPDEEREQIRRNNALIQAACGERPLGWISPRGTGSMVTPQLLAEEGYLWHGDCNDDDVPHIAVYGEGKDARRIVGIPLTMDVNDMPSSVRYGNTPRAMLEAFQDAFDAMLGRETSTMFLDVTAHTHVYGRPAGAWVYDEIMAIVKRRPEVWTPTREEMARWMLAQVPN
jgi:peptidoglycan/xylan/chitin deacetylase (PgdA/CDA1 family)